MITGTVNAVKEAVIRLKARGFSGQEHEFDAVVDTGFTGYLTLPPTVIAGLGLPFAGHQQIILGDGSVQVVEIYTGLVEWDGIDVLVTAESEEVEPLVGMALMDGYRLTVDNVGGGAVTLELLPIP